MNALHAVREFPFRPRQNTRTAALKAQRQSNDMAGNHFDSVKLGGSQVNLLADWQWPYTTHDQVLVLVVSGCARRTLITLHNLHCCPVTRLRPHARTDE